MEQIIQAGLIEEEPGLRTTAGRPSKVFRLADQSARVIGAVVDIRSCTIVSSGLSASVEDEWTIRFPTPNTYELLISKLAETIDELRSRHGAPCLGVGLSIPGLIDRRKGQVVFSPNLHFTDGQFPARDLERALGLETIMIQEEHALCLAEKTYGAARGISDFAIIDISSGLGMGVVSGGRYIDGHCGFGGELGHIPIVPDGPLCGCGRRGCLETLASDTAVSREISSILDRPAEIDEIVTLAKEYPEVVLPVLERAVHHLANGISIVVSIFNPSQVFIFGRMFDADPALFEKLNKEVSTRTIGPSFNECGLVRAHGDKQLGALAGIISRLFHSLGPRVQGP
jgi:N-acetylglucosamine repressor